MSGFRKSLRGRRLAGAVTSVVAVAGTLTACSSNDSPTAVDPDAANAPAAAECAPVRGGAFSAGGLADYEPLSTTELRDAVDLTAAATLTRIVPGYSEVDDGDEFPYLFAEFAVTEVFAGAAEVNAGDGELRIRLDQGAMNGDTGEPYFSIEDFQAALPEGTKAILFVNDVTDQIGKEALSKLGLAEGDKIFRPHWQGVVLDNCGSLVGGKDKLAADFTEIKTIEELATKLRQ